MSVAQVSNRFAAFGIHLGISFLLFIVLAIFIRLVWYPGFLFEVDGGWQGIKLIAGVDLVIGPLLTLLVFNVNKKNLKRDLVVIGCLQFICLVAGMGVVGYSRPLVVAYYDGEFSTLNRISFEGSKKDVSEISRYISWVGPTWVSLELPEDSTERAVLLSTWGFLGEDIATNVELYRPYAENLDLLKHEGSPMLEGGQRFRRLSYRGRFYTGDLLIDLNSGDVVDVLTKD